MEKLRNDVLEILTEEHEAWVKQLEEAEKNDKPVDINLGGGFAKRVQKLNKALSEYENRNKTSKKGGFFG